MQELVTAIILLYIVPVSCGILYIPLYVLQSCSITAECTVLDTACLIVYYSLFVQSCTVQYILIIV